MGGGGATTLLSVSPTRREKWMKSINSLVSPLLTGRGGKEGEAGNGRGRVEERDRMEQLKILFFSTHQAAKRVVVL